MVINERTDRLSFEEASDPSLAEALQLLAVVQGKDLLEGAPTHADGHCNIET